MIDELRSILPAPSAPCDVDAEVLQKNQEVLTVMFPDDFVEYSLEYGSGEVSDDMYSWNVVSAASPYFPVMVNQFFETYSESRESFLPYSIPLALFPEPDGLLPFGLCDNGVWWCWKTSGLPNAWPIVDLEVWDDDGFQIFNMGFTEFLVKLLKGELELSGRKFTSDPNKEITFTPKAFRFSTP